MLGELLLGIAGGSVTGITPGIHTNTLSSLVRGVDFGVFLMLYAMGLTHTFLDAVPSAFLGVPDEGTELAVLPAHRLALKGRALEVVAIALRASLMAVLFSLAFLPLYALIAPLYRQGMGRYLVFLLFFLLVATERGVKRLAAVTVFLLSGAFGILLEGLPLKQAYYHAFAGLFGVPTIVLSGEGRIEGNDTEILMPRARFVVYSFLGTLLGGAASLFPAFTSSQAAMLATFFSRDERAFLTVAFSVNTSNFVLSLANFYLTGRTRNGVLVALREYPLAAAEFRALLVASLFVAFLVNLYGIHLARALLRIISRLDYRKLNISTLLMLIFLSLYFDGSLGLLTLLTGSLIGLSAVKLGVKRTNCMGVLMLPIMLGK
ncbi:tripartite tricarboxylate transporter permease [Palaeococcus ferrophilus]|uniref:tripartite tricarboxylate transporter permease n=1 Tax=Palaeococcus ferrophilus TaxID=83868 RepID=UPI00064E6239|nr:tripartite tricarboxylate transporter permease [Palaeococcus ferrophilus]